MGNLSPNTRVRIAAAGDCDRYLAAHPQNDGQLGRVTAAQADRFRGQDGQPICPKAIAYVVDLDDGGSHVACEHGLQVL